MASGAHKAERSKLNARRGNHQFLSACHSSGPICALVPPLSSHKLCPNSLGGKLTPSSTNAAHFLSLDSPIFGPERTPTTPRRKGLGRRRLSIGGQLFRLAACGPPSTPPNTIRRPLFAPSDRDKLAGSMSHFRGPLHWLPMTVFVGA